MTGKTKKPRVGGGGAATVAGMNFQAKLGSIIGAWILSEQSFDVNFDLHGVFPIWMRFETEAPVDDILVATAAGGFVAIQAKTTTSLSEKPDSDFSKTISQFVKHWLACYDGDGNRGWNRPLSVEKDRLVLAVGNKAPKSLCIDLPNAFRINNQPGGGELNVAQQKVFDVYSACVKNAWSKATKNPFDAKFPNDLAQLIRIFVSDPEKDGLQAISHSIIDGTSHETALAVLEKIVSEMMEQRGGANQPTLRQRLFSRGVALAASPNYANDIEKLKSYSTTINENLSGYEAIEDAEGQSISIPRECQSQIEDAAREDSLLIIGEPGSGKSAVLNSLARTLRDDGNDVIELSVDRLSVETLEGLGRELELDHSLLNVINAWDGVKPAWLVIDALDATRGGRGEGAFHKLIAQVLLEKNSRWKVVASIRTFDLRVGQRLKALFDGNPPIEHLQEQEFSDVRHVKIPEWSETEFKKLLNAIPALNDALERAPEVLLNLARVPFNTRLISDLVRRGLVAGDFSNVSSQSQLLNLYWDKRVGLHQDQARSCILRIVKAMISARALRIPINDIESTGIDGLKREGVIITDKNGRYIYFRHHLLFDYAAAHVLIDPEGLINGSFRFPKAEAQGLMLAPALSFVLREIWESDDDRSGFWSAAAIILADEDADPVIRGSTGRICAEYPEYTVDTAILAKRVVAGDTNAAQAFIHTCGAFAVRLEDDTDAPTAPWASLLAGVSETENLLPIAGAVRFLLFKFVKLELNNEKRLERLQLGLAARALLRYALSSEKLQSMAPTAIHLVAVTFVTDPEESCKLLEQLFEIQRLQKDGWENIPALCRQIENIAVVKPDFAIAIYKETFGFEVIDKTKTRIGGSQILNLTSNAQQDYNSARYVLAKFVPKFLTDHPKEAIGAIVDVCDSFVARRYQPSVDSRQLTVSIEGRKIRLKEDHSRTWAHNPEKPRDHDANALVYELLKFLRSSEEIITNNIIKKLINKVSLAVFWSRMFMVAAERNSNNSLIDILLPIAATEQFLVSLDTRKDAIDLVAKCYDRLLLDDRIAFENSVKEFNFPTSYNSEEYKAFVRTLFFKIGSDNLATKFAKAIIADIKSSEHNQNDRYLTVRDVSGKSQPYGWMKNLDRDSPSEQELMQAIESTKETLGIDNNNGANDAPKSKRSIALATLLTLESKIDRSQHNSELIEYAEGVIGQGLNRIISLKLVPDKDDNTATDQLLGLISVVCASDNPTIEQETEDKFERIPSWTIPSARVEAGAVVLDLVFQRPDVYPRLATTIDALIADPHPGVRLESGRHLVRISDMDSDGFWRRLTDRIHYEKNLGVLESLVNDVLSRFLHSNSSKVEILSTDLLEIFKYSEQSDRQASIRNALVDIFSILWVSHGIDKAYRIVNDWVGNGDAHHDELVQILQAIRGGFLLGFKEDAEDGHDEISRRAIDLTLQIVKNSSDRLAMLHACETWTPEQEESASKDAEILDIACRGIYFEVDDNEAQVQSYLKNFFKEVKPVLEHISDYGTPHTIHYLLQILELLIPIDPVSSFDMIARALKGGGRKSGYHYESMGADLMVKLLGTFLADHKELFEDDQRRVAIIDCLGIFMDAGWPPARRLLYQLPELIQ